MKKFLSMTLLFTVMFLMFSACSNDDDESAQEVTSTYTFVYTANMPPQGVTCSFILFEYNEKSEAIAQHTIDNYQSGYKGKFNANPKSEKVKVYMIIKTQKRSEYKWVQTIYYLEKGKDVSVIVTGDTVIGPDEP